jgi:hypothetical protein
VDSADRSGTVLSLLSQQQPGMFYFFQKQQEFLQCEIRTADAPDTFAIVITEPNGSERSQYVVGSAEVSRRWRQLQQELVGEGWWGPCGRD